MQGALFGARSLATGLGPIIFAALFALFSRSDTGLPYFPGAWPRLCRTALSVARPLIQLLRMHGRSPLCISHNHSWRTCHCIPASFQSPASNNLRAG